MSGEMKLYISLIFSVMLAIILFFTNDYLYEDTGEVELVSEIEGEKLISLVENREIYIKEKLVDGKTHYTFKYENEDGKVEEITVFDGEATGITIWSPESTVEYFEEDTDEPLIKIERKLITHPIWGDIDGFNKTTIIMPK